MGWFRLSVKGWRWWHSFTPRGRAIRRWLRYAQDKIEKSINLEQIQKCNTNVLLFGQCNGDCGGDWHKQGNARILKPTRKKQ